MPVDLFHIVEGAQAILYSGGVFKQVKVYRRGADLYAAHGGGFVKMLGHNGTTHPRVSWRDLHHSSTEITIQKNGTPVWEE